MIPGGGVDCLWKNRYIQLHVHNVNLEKVKKLKKKLEELKSELQSPLLCGPGQISPLQ